LSFDFQKELMVSFNKIYANLKEDQVEIKEFLIMCVLSILQTYANKLKSGWEIVLHLIDFALDEKTPNLNIMANRVIFSLIFFNCIIVFFYHFLMKFHSKDAENHH